MVPTPRLAGGPEQRLQTALPVGIAVAKALLQLHSVGLAHGQISANSVVLDALDNPLLDLRRMSPKGLATAGAALPDPAAATATRWVVRGGAVRGGSQGRGSCGAVLSSDGCSGGLRLPS